MCKFVLFFVKVKHETTNYYKLHSSFNFKFPVKGEMNNFPFKLKSAEYFFFWILIDLNLRLVKPTLSTI